MDDLNALLEATGDQDLLMTNEEIRRRDAGKFLLYHIKAYIAMIVRRKRRLAACLKIQTFYRMRFVKNSSFIKALQLAKCPKIYFLKEQKPQFMRLLRKMVSHLK